MPQSHLEAYIDSEARARLQRVEVINALNALVAEVESQEPDYRDGKDFAGKYHYKFRELVSALEFYDQRSAERLQAFRTLHGGVANG